MTIGSLAKSRFLLALTRERGCPLGALHLHRRLLVNYTSRRRAFVRILGSPGIGDYCIIRSASANVDGAIHPRIWIHIHHRQRGSQNSGKVAESMQSDG